MHTFVYIPVSEHFSFAKIIHSCVARFWSQVQEWLKNCNICLELMVQIAILCDLKSHSQSINNIIISIPKNVILNLQSVEAMRIERFGTFVKHHSTVEKYMANRNPKWMV